MTKTGATRVATASRRRGRNGGLRPGLITLVLSLAPIVVGVAYAHAAFGRVEIARPDQESLFGTQRPRQALHIRRRPLAE